MDFSLIHSKTEEIYNEMSVLYEDTAERVLQLGKKPYLTINELSFATNIETETKDSFSSKEVINAIIKDYTYLLSSFKELAEIASSENDKTTESFSDEKVAKLEKELWILNSMAL